MKKIWCSGSIILLLACNHAGDGGEGNINKTDTVVIHADSVRNSRTDGTEIDAMVLDTAVR